MRREVKIKDNQEQYSEISLFPEGTSEEKKPRAREIPAYKNTEASASVFGWRFQVIAGIIFSLKNIKELKAVEIEGLTEDIELDFENKEPEYIQAKSVQYDYINAKNSRKATDAMNTLINTSNLTKGKYSKLVYVANFRNPLSLSENMLKAIWEPSMLKPFIRPYSSLPKEAKDFVDKRIEGAQKQLAGDYLATTDYFFKDKLYISTILLNPDEGDPTRFDVLEETLKCFFQDLKVNVPFVKIIGVKNMLITFYLQNAGSKANSLKHHSITKKDLIWQIIFELIKDIPDEFLKIVPLGMENEIDIYAERFIKE